MRCETTTITSSLRSQKESVCEKEGGREIYTYGRNPDRVVVVDVVIHEEYPSWDLGSVVIIFRLFLLS